MNAGDISAEGARLGRKADDSDLFDHAVRVGLVSYGVVHLLVGWLALRLVFGGDAGSASTDGALSEVAQKPFGQISLYVVAAGFLALVLWQATEALVGHRTTNGVKRVGKRLASVGKAVVYAALGYSAGKIAVGGGSGGGSTDTLTARLMSVPGGQILVALFGAALLAVAGFLMWRGISGRFKADLEIEGRTGHSGTAFVTFGRIGYVSKGLALVAVGGLFAWAAWSHDPAKSGGLDQALGEVLQQPFGTPILILTALGIGCYGIYCFVWARHLDR